MKIKCILPYIHFNCGIKMKVNYLGEVTETENGDEECLTDIFHENTLAHGTAWLLARRVAIVLECCRVIRLVRLRASAAWFAAPTRGLCVAWLFPLSESDVWSNDEAFLYGFESLLPTTALRILDPVGRCTRLCCLPDVLCCRWTYPTRLRPEVLCCRWRTLQSLKTKYLENNTTYVCISKLYMLLIRVESVW